MVLLAATGIRLSDSLGRVELTFYFSRHIWDGNDGLDLEELHGTKATKRPSTSTWRPSTSSARPSTSSPTKTWPIVPTGFRHEEELEDEDATTSSAPSEEEEKPLTPREERARRRRNKLLSVSQHTYVCLLYTSPSPRDKRQSRMPSSA